MLIFAKMFPVSTSVITTCIIVTLLVYLLTVTLLNGYKSKISVNILAILLMLWIILQSTLALNGWYMNYRTTLPHWLFACLVPWTFLLFLYRKTYHFETTIQALCLHLLVACRIGIALNLWQLAGASQLPKRLIIVAVIIEII